MVLLSHLWYSMLIKKIIIAWVSQSTVAYCGSQFQFAVCGPTANMGTTKWGQENQERAGGI